MGLFGLLVAIAGELVLLPRVRAYLDAATRADALERVETVLFPVAGLLMLGSIYTIVLGMRILRARRWPLPGAFVLRDTPVSTGIAARLRGASLLAMGALLAAAAGWTAMLPRLLFASGPP
jgi:hypothetical protein